MLRPQTPSPETQNVSQLRELIGVVCLTWYIVVWFVCGIGFTQLFRYYSKTPPPATCLTSISKDEIPHVTIIRPVKGLEPRLYECLGATFLQTYPSSRLTIYFCIASRADPALPVLERLVRDFQGFDVKIFIEEEDPLLVPEHQKYSSRKDRDGNGDRGRVRVELGPNPKIRNMSRAYREAKGDIVWIIDCNVWVGSGVCGRMVDLLCGFGGKRKNKFVHQLPLVVDMDGEGIDEEDRKRLLGGEQETDGDNTTSSSSEPNLRSGGKLRRLMQRGGGRLEEMFMSSSHAKFYTAINTVLIAPCIVGKSNMFRRSHLNYLTDSNPSRAPGIDFFSDNICEDHLIGDELWKKPQAFELLDPKNSQGGTETEKYGKHALLFGDICFQPVSHTSVSSYIARRVRWLRVRKFTVTLATLVEPGTESILNSLYGAYAITTLPFFQHKLGIPPRWSTFVLFWLASMTLWCLVDWIQYGLLHSAASVELDPNSPDFTRTPCSSSSLAERQPLLTNSKGKSRPDRSSGTRRTFPQWFVAWLGREVLAFPIWAWAVWGGVSVSWRGKSFWVGMDMKVHEISTKKDREW
ncbi:glycosyltransferase family 21 protein [Zopfia rhizophila CBS 207.26]|uniref:Ceramide glucosyltransferase n=1 Tax=Zopfia rhizophila CBS 207.26 TaxID=1314779 RepID=A0A6A6DNQ6_9PEZI|nr:glycosyltransferase family 21 protein [Zopfia rhizophila CBS 207.26]